MENDISSKRNIAIIILSIILILVLLTGCGKKEEKSNNTENKEETKVEKKTLVCKGPDFIFSECNNPPTASGEPGPMKCYKLGDLTQVYTYENDEMKKYKKVTTFEGENKDFFKSIYGDNYDILCNEVSKELTCKFDETDEKIIMTIEGDKSKIKDKKELEIFEKTYDEIKEINESSNYSYQEDEYKDMRTICG